MGLFDLFRRKQPTALDALRATPGFGELDAVQLLMRRMSQEGDGVDADEIPGGIGEFGLSSRNHVPTDSILGSTAYLGCLRAEDGARVIYRRQGSTITDNAPGPVDIYALSHPDGRGLGTVYLCPYHKRISRKAPRGFTLSSSSLAR